MVTHHWGSMAQSDCGVPVALAYSTDGLGFTSEWDDVDCVHCLARRPVPKPQLTEFEEKREALAKSLFELYHGPGTWGTVGKSADYRLNYRVDATEVLVMQPHLLTATERVRLWREERDLLLATFATIDRAEVRAGWEMFFIEMREAVDE